VYLLLILNNWRGIRFNDLANYIYERQNEDGGYTFARGAESSAQDTYYAVEILKMLNAPLKNVDKTILFLRSLQHSDGGFDSIKVGYYAIMGLDRLGAQPTRTLSGFIHFIKVFISIEKPVEEVYVETVSEIENLCFSIELLKKLNKLNLLKSNYAEQILKLQNSDGSFGSIKHSKIASTYYALKILKILNYDIATLNTLNWIRRCEVPNGGFIAAPGLSPLYITIEDIYYGIKSLELLNSRCRYPRETLELIKRFQNPNGGFRRSIFLGISNFESTYQALSSIEAIQK
jgi:hypothetical protein